MNNLENKRWTPEEDEFAYKNIYKIPDDELELKLGRSIRAIHIRLHALYKSGRLNGKTKRWNQIEDEMLISSYGNISTDLLASKLFRSKASIRSRLERLSGTHYLNSINGDFVLSEVALIMGHHTYHVRRSLEKIKLPYKKIDKTILIESDKFWKWLKVNCDFINVKNIKCEELYHCPKWYVDIVNKMKKDERNKLNSGKYTNREIVIIKHLISNNKTNNEIAAELNRDILSINYIISKLIKNKELYSRAI